jgi:hypothetical protein
LQQLQAWLAALDAAFASGGQSWFTRLRGDRGVATAQEVAFISFLNSPRFAAGGGATDGYK